MIEELAKYGISTFEVVTLSLFFLFFFIAGLVGLGVFLWYTRWNWRYTIYKDVAGKGYVPLRTKRMRLIRVGHSGVQLFYLHDLKEYKIGYNRLIGKRHIAFAEGKDGFWRNILFEDIDEKLHNLGFNPIQKDARYAYAAGQKLVRDRYDDRDFILKWGVWIILLFLIIFALVNGTASFVQGYYAKKVAEQNANGMSNLQKSIEDQNKIYANLDKFGIGGSGIR